jgi:hypothetical protein
MMMMNAPARRAIFRLALVVLWAVSLAALFITGRGHTLIVDNGAAAKTDLSGGLESLGDVKVTVNGGKAVPFARGDRDRFTVSGLSVRVLIERGRGGGGDAAFPFEAVVNLPLWPDALMLSLPRLAAGCDDALTVFEELPAPPPDDAESEQPAPEL